MPQNFLAFSKKFFIVGLSLIFSIFLNSSKSSFCLLDNDTGTSGIILMYKSPKELLLKIGIPLSFNLNCFPCCVPAGILTFTLLPSIQGTSIVAPNAASAYVIGSSKNKFSSDLLNKL